MSLVALTEAIANQLQQLNSRIPELQVGSQMLFTPTPPAIDLYPADPFQEQADFGPLVRTALFTVRARVSTIDSDGGQTLLLGLLDPAAPESVTAALTADPTFAGACQTSMVEGPSGYIQYTDPVGQSQNLLGAEWRLHVTL